jgi:hypothetical protein
MSLSQTEKLDFGVQHSIADGEPGDSATPAFDEKDDFVPITATRSRRPTMYVVPSTVANFKPATKKKWTVKRVIKVSWAYVTTLKVVRIYKSQDLFLFIV